MILYGSETGNAQDVAGEIARTVERLHFDTVVLDMDAVHIRDLLRYSAVIFSLSTTGQGEIPQNARKFWRLLLSGALKPGAFQRRLRFTSFGIGDSSYARYNVAHRMLGNRLSQLGAHMFCRRGEGNEQHPEGHSAGLREWIISLKQELIELFPFSDGQSPVPEDVFLEPKWRLDLAESINPMQLVLNGSDPSDTPSEAVIPVRESHTAHITTNNRITPLSHFQDVRLLDLRLESNISYSPGAVAVVYPKNFPDDVQQFINLMKWNSIADCELVLSTNPTINPKTAPLRHLNLTTVKLTLRWLLENVLDIMSIPRRSFFASLAHFAGEKTNDERYQKERLLELADPNLIDELWDYTTRPKRTIFEVMMDFTTISIPWKYVLSAIPTMKGRQFSIASGGNLRIDNYGGTRVQLLVAIANPPSPIIKWRKRYGVCTRYIASLRAGQQIHIGIQPGYLNVQPSELDAPVVMIGPGTGVAPMRAMVHQRLMWACEAGVGRSHRKLTGDLLFFGCRNEEADYFFRSEWEELSREAGLAVFAAFSRDKDRPRQYVQDRIRQRGEAVCEAIFSRNGKVYLCGSSGNMPKGVREALIDVLMEHQHLSRENAECYLDTMEKQSRFKQETW